MKFVVTHLQTTHYNVFFAGDYFDFTFDKCYCTTCHAKSGDEKFYTRGNPPKIYSVPVGWCRFAIR